MRRCAARSPGRAHSSAARSTAPARPATRRKTRLVSRAIGSTSAMPYIAWKAAGATPRTRRVRSSATGGCRTRGPGPGSARPTGSVAGTRTVNRLNSAPARLAPIANPRGIATTAAMAIALAHADSVSRTASHRAAVVARSTRAAKISLNGGNAERGRRPTRGATSNAVTTTATPMAGRATASAQRRRRPDVRTSVLLAIVPPVGPGLSSSRRRRRGAAA